MIETSLFGAVRDRSAKEREMDGTYSPLALEDEDVISSFDALHENNATLTFFTSESAL